MHVQTHILSGWCAGNQAPGFTPRQRLFCMIAASAPDLDGLGIILWPINHELGQNLYWDYHHRLGHCLVFGLVTSGLLAWFSPRRALSFLAYLAMFHLHLLMDVVGSGEGWKIHYLWPFSDIGIAVAWAWDLSSWQNRVAFLILFIWTIVIALRQRRTPLEQLMPSLDQKLVRKTPASDDVLEAPRSG